MELSESKYYLSVYPTKESTLYLQVNPKDIKFQTQEPSIKDTDKIIYGPYHDVTPLSFEQISLSYVFPYPMPVFTEAKRDIYVSHWGSISIDEYFNLFNEAAAIDGQFSRVDYAPHINPN